MSVFISRLHVTFQMLVWLHGIKVNLFSIRTLSTFIDCFHAINVTKTKGGTVSNKRTLFRFMCFSRRAPLMIRHQNGLTDVKRQLKQLLDRCSTQPVCQSFRERYDLDALSIDLQFQEVRPFRLTARLLDPSLAYWTRFSRDLRASVSLERALVARTTGVAKLATNSPKRDALTVPALASSAPGQYHQLKCLRESERRNPFLRNDPPVSDILTRPLGLWWLAFHFRD